MSASECTITGAWPPSSRLSFFSVRADCSTIWRPTGTEPVKLTLATRASFMIVGVTSAGRPTTRLTLPAGKPASSKHFTNAIVAPAASLDGRITSVLPAASAGATLRASSSSGKFHGTKVATTPSGSRCTR